MGREKDLREKRLAHLEPGETVKFRFSIEFFEC